MQESFFSSFSCTIGLGMLCCHWEYGFRRGYGGMFSSVSCILCIKWKISMVLWARLSTSGLTRVGMQLWKSLCIYGLCFLGTGTQVLGNLRESQTLNIISHVFGIAQISVDASILQRGKEERKARLWRVVAKAEGGLFHTRNYDYEQGEGYHAFRYSGPLFCSGFLRERE